MPCFQPLIRVEHQNLIYQTKTGKYAKKAHIYSFDDYGKQLEKIKDFENIKVMPIPCGQCIGCRLEKSRDWANRGYLEASLHKENYFVTLTYNENHLPMKSHVEHDGKIYLRDETWTGTLEKRDLQLFIKRLRNETTKFSYMACGEYGEKNGRPHYHLIIFGAELPSETFYNARIINNETYWQNDIIEKCWVTSEGKGKCGESLGISNISEVSWNNIAYVARYITKKITGPNSKEEYAKMGREPEFNLASKNPAIGKEWFNLNHAKIIDNDEIIIKNKSGVHHVKPPKYFDKLIEKNNPELREEMKEKRRKEGIEKAKTKDTKTSNKRIEQLKIEESTQRQKAKTLKREIKDGNQGTTNPWKKGEEPTPRMKKVDKRTIRSLFG